MGRPYTLWAAAVLGTVLAALFAAGHVLATLKHVSQLQVLLRGPAPRLGHYTWGNDIPMQLFIHDFDDHVPGLAFAGGLLNDTDAAATPVVTHKLHCPDAMHAGYVTLADHPEYAECLRQHLLSAAHYAEHESAHGRGGGAAKGVESGHCTNDGCAPAVLRAAVYA